MKQSLMESAARFRNGHHVEKARGKTEYTGPLEFLPPPEPITSIEAAAERMYTDGCVQIPDLLSPAEVAEMRQWADQNGGPDEKYIFPGWCFNKLLVMDLQREPIWLKLIDRSPAYEILELILGKRFVIVGGNFWVTGKGRAMPIHLDRLAVTLPEEMLRDPRVRVPIFTAMLHIYLDDQVKEIGPTTVIPGSHLAGRPPIDESTWNGQSPKMVSVKAGGAILFRHDLWHGAAMNSSDRRRYLIQLQYGEPSRRQSGPPITRPKFYSPEILERATPRQRIMMGEGNHGIYD